MAHMACPTVVGNGISPHPHPPFMYPPGGTQHSLSPKRGGTPTGGSETWTRKCAARWTVIRTMRSAGPQSPPTISSACALRCSQPRICLKAQ